MKASIVEIRGSETKGLGDYKFMQLPGAGDRIVVGAAPGTLQIMKTLYVEHAPLKLPATKTDEEFGPSATVYVVHHEYWDPDMVE